MRFCDKDTRIRKLRTRLITVFLVMVVLFLGRAVFDVLGKYRESAHNVAETRSSFSGLEAREDKLIEELSFLETEQGVESEIRKKFSVAREGEKAVILLGHTPEDDVDEKQKTSNPLFRLLELLHIR
jgi:hypothetical protein